MPRPPTPLPLPLFLAALLACALPASASDLALAGDRFSRHLSWQGDTLVTTAFVDPETRRTIAVDSDEFGVRLSDGTLLTARDFAVDRSSLGRQPGLITYARRAGRPYPAAAPLRVVVAFQAQPNLNPRLPGRLTKSVTVTLPSAVLLHSLEVERFRTSARAQRGGRGEPVVLANAWILLPQNPTTLTRHTDGNTPVAYTHRFEKVGNHSFVDFEGGDLEPNPQTGLVRCFHFPPQAVADGAGTFTVASQAVHLLLSPAGTLPEAFVIDSVRPAPRPFTHYNNWFDPAGKNLKEGALLKVYRDFQRALARSGITLDAMVPDSGWQEKKSLWQPALTQFPGGLAEFARLGEALRAEGSSLGLWLALDRTNNDVPWSEAQGYTRAKPNAYFSRYFAHLSLADPKYRADLSSQLDTLITTGRLSYFKFDFNHLSHVVPTDRHGHEAEMNGFIAVSDVPRRRGVFVNATNWTWHSPAWLHYADTVWLLAGDDGFNGNWPELSGRAQATTDRDLFFWRMWGDPADRPWFPISSIMTHGIVRNARGQMAFATDLARDWSDYVLMHYGRGTLLREWYLSPQSLLPHEWTALIAIHRWADSRLPSLTRTCFVGGRPDEGQAYGYLGWDHAARTGTLVARNPAAAGQTLRVPLDATTLFPAAPGQPWHARIVYPYRQDLPIQLRSGAVAEIAIPGQETIAVEFEPGAPRDEPISFAPQATVIPGRAPAELKVTFAASADLRRELQVIGYPTLPTVLINGQAATPSRTRQGVINKFPNYARNGMPSTRARPWAMAGYDLSALGDGEFVVAIHGADAPTRAEAWLLTERAHGGTPASAELTPLTFSGRQRQTHRLLAETDLPPAPR